MNYDDDDYDMNQDILDRIAAVAAAAQAADAVIPNVFAQMADRAYGDMTPEILAIRVMDVDATAREIILAEAYALGGILSPAPSGYTEDYYSDEMTAAGFGMREVGLAFHAVDDAARECMHAGLGERDGEILGLPLTVIKGHEVDVRCAAAWLRVRPASANYWAMLDALMAPAA